MKQTILVTGVTGNIGNEVVKALLPKNVDIKVGARDLSKVQNMPWAGQVSMVELDYDKPETVKNSLEGVDKLFLVTVAGEYKEHSVAELILANASSLKQIVRLSGMGAEDHDLFARHASADKAFMDSSIDYTSLQPNMFMQNLFNYQLSIKESHKIIEPAGNGAISLIDARDIGAVGAEVLTSAGHANKIYVLTGSKSFNFSEVARMLSEELGVEINYEPLSEAEFIKVKVAAGIPAEFADKFVQFFKMVADGDYSKVTSCVADILGREPITFKEFAHDYKHEFI